MLILYKKPPVIFLLFLSLFSPAAFAQQSFKDILKMKTEKQIRSIIDSSPAITGLMVIDLTNGESSGINEDLVFPTASAIKVSILMEVFRQASAKKFALTDMRTIEPRNIVGGSGVLKDLPDPVSLSIRNLCVLMMLLSDNTATNTILELVTLKSVNTTMQSLGFNNTRVQRKMMDMAAAGRGEENISSPSEAAGIMQLLFKGNFISKTMSADILSLMSGKDREDSRIAKSIPASVPIIFKPGSLTGVSTEWAVVNLKERPYVVVMMENFKVEGKATDIMEKVSGVLYQYFWRLGNATKYGSYIDPKMIQPYP